MRSSVDDLAVFGLLLAAGCAPLGTPASRGVQVKVGEINMTMTAKDLYAGFEASKVVLDEKGEKLLLDARAFNYAHSVKGVVTTDVLAPGQAEGVIGLDAELKGVEVAVSAELPEGTTATVETRSGASFFDQSKWSEWKKLEGLAGKVREPRGRYLQVRITLKSSDAAKLPTLASLRLKPEFGRSSRLRRGDIEVLEEKIQKIVKSPVEFKYERPDQPKLVKFRKAAKLDEVVAGKMDGKTSSPELRNIDRSMKGAGEDFLQLVRLMDWAGSCHNDRKTRRHKKPGYYAWDIDLVWRLVDVEGVKRPTVYGHCMSYAEVLITAASAMGFKGRHSCVCGFREANHEICDIWVPSLGKWVYFDPSLTNYYYDKKTRLPMNLIEMHTLIADKFVPKGKDMHWWTKRGGQETRARVREVGGKKHIGCRLGRWRYGAPMPAGYNWGYSHGYLAAGFVQMTPRNDFHSQPRANPRKFEYGPGYAGYPNWVDEKTPPKRGGRNYYTRMRDFYWTLDQASFKLTMARGAAGTIEVELGNSMPFFKEYGVEIDGKKVREKGSSLSWRLKRGENRLEVAPIDEFGRRGSSSSVTVKRK